ncbi:MAG: GIY-YIG nuclease family protein [Rhodobacteraceae bacterium]|nr:GIY-YIG nuclease family protein [Paracoccaceae bacterium]
MTLFLNTILRAEGIEAHDVSVILHTTNVQPLRDMLPFIAAERPDLLDAYQSVHSDQAAATLRNRPLAATFVPFGQGCMVFVGLFRITNVEELATKEIYKDPRFFELEENFGATDTGPEVNIRRRETQLKFTMDAIEPLSELRGRLQILAPSGRAYVRIASNLDAEIVEISKTSASAKPPPNWDEFTITGPLVNALPTSWSARLREWRGVYLIVDETDGARYVGSAYGETNLLGRWQAHTAGEKGVTNELKHRNPGNFRFSILQLVAPTAEPSEVVNLEHSWMNRLHTREFGLNA